MCIRIVGVVTVISNLIILFKFLKKIYFYIVMIVHTQINQNVSNCEQCFTVGSRT